MISQLMFIDDPIVSGMVYFRTKGEMSFQEIMMYYDVLWWMSCVIDPTILVEHVLGWILVRKCEFQLFQKSFLMTKLLTYFPNLKIV